MIIYKLDIQYILFSTINSSILFEIYKIRSQSYVQFTLA